ncbi:hypothetical protein AQUCO_05600093v1 [Aquilegia coerulea]|uniref:RIN4 pathogenic type III effector avirulence factor Avr cleavage site domain-containing protein n=1 Tax=Aquilegia coerulea TaxID=218851 RepID=A0A2G5CGL2_AQUCA|nr:hypothetical protein AQUCO_05600093v1 [Aquilegia coerulea]
MTSQDTGRSLPKFGDWDVNNPTSSDFSVIFSKARDEKKANVKAGNVVSPARNDNAYQPKEKKRIIKKSKWLCCG